MRLLIKPQVLRHVLIPTDSFGQTREFYVNVLGLNPIGVPPRRNPDVRVEWLDCGGVELHIAERTLIRPDRPPGGFNTSLEPHIAFEVEGIENARTKLTSTGHRILYESPINAGVSKRVQIWVRDPSGMVVELYEDRQ